MYIHIYLFMELFKRELTRNQRTQHTEEFKMKLIKRNLQPCNKDSDFCGE